MNIPVSMGSSKPMTLIELKDAIAKAIADAVGNGMREKYEAHADAALSVVGPQLLVTAEHAAQLVREREALRAEAREKAEPVAWMSPGKERLEFSRPDTVYGSHTIPLYTAPPAERVRVPDGWELGNVDISADNDLWTAGINIPVDRRYSSNGVHWNAIECHALTKEQAEALRSQVMLSAVPSTSQETGNG